MRKYLEAVSLAALVFLFVITVRALHGPNPLPAKIPTHFGVDGQPNGWGSPSMLFLLPSISAGIYLLMTLVARFPGAFNYPVRVTTQNRARLQSIALNMIAWLKAEVVGLMAWIQVMTIEAARQAHSGALLALLAPVSLVAVFGTIAWHIVAMVRAARAD